MSVNSSAQSWQKKIRSLRALVAYPLWVLVVFIASVGIFGGVQLTEDAHIPGLLELLQSAGVPFETMDESVLAVIITVLVWTVVLAGVLVLPRLMPGKRTTTRKELGLTRMPTWTDIGLGIVGFVPYAIGAVMLMYVVQQLVPGFDVDQVQETGFDASVTNQLNRIMAFLALVVIGPIVEEILFRGYLYGKLRRYGVIVATLVVSVLFGILHGQWNVALNVFVLSLVLCGLREVTGNIWAGILLHMLKNGIAYYALFITPLLVN